MIEFSYLETRYDKEDKVMAVWIDYINIECFIEALGLEVYECCRSFELGLCEQSLYINMWNYENGNYRNWLKDLSKLNKYFKKMYEEY